MSAIDENVSENYNTMSIVVDGSIGNDNRIRRYAADDNRRFYISVIE